MTILLYIIFAAGISLGCWSFYEMWRALRGGGESGKDWQAYDGDDDDERN